MFSHRRRVAPCVALICLGATAPSGARELDLPRRSPRARVTQQVGLTRISVDYNSLPARGAEIWGQRVALGREWIEGETPAPRVTFSRDVIIGERRVPAGTYALVSTPGPSRWTVILNRDAELMVSRREHRPELDVARVEARVEPAEYRERLVFYFADFNDDAAVLDLEWERWRVSIPIRLDTRAQIEAGLHGLDDVWRSYADLAQYMLESRRHYDAGLSLVERSLALTETWRNLWIKASLLAAKRRFFEAREAGARAYALWQDSGQPAVAGLDIPGTLASWPHGAEPRPIPIVERAVAIRASGAAKGARASRNTFAEPDLPSGLIAIVDEQGAAPAAKTEEPLRKTESARSSLAERPVRLHEPARAADTGDLGAPSQDAIMKVVEQGRGDLRACYQRVLRRDPDLTRGKIRLTIDIGASGRAKNVSIDAPERLRAIEPCVRTALSRWMFPASSAEYSAELPLVLQGGE